MAAFIVAIRGTVGQAVLLGLAATVSHTAVVWLVAIGGMHLGRSMDAETTEPYFLLASAVIIVAIALWMLWRTWRDQRRAAAEVRGHHDHAPGSELHRIDTGHGVVLRLSHGDHGHDYDVAFTEQDHAPAHDHRHEELRGLDVSTGGYCDAHELAHANDIRRRFADRNVTTGQIVLFGLTGGLIPCPAAITVLLLCLQLKEITLGAALVLCFSIGLAVTLVVVGAAAALSVRHVSKRWSGFGAVVRRAPYFSSALIGGIGIYMAIHALTRIAA